MTQEAELGLRDRLAQLSGVKLPGRSSAEPAFENGYRDTTDEEIWRRSAARHEQRPYTLDYVERILRTGSSSTATAGGWTTARSWPHRSLDGRTVALVDIRRAAT